MGRVIEFTGSAGRLEKTNVSMTTHKLTEACTDQSVNIN